MLEAVGEVFPEAKYQRCVVHFYRNVFSVVPRSKVKLVAKMLNAIHAQESKKAAREKAKAVVAELLHMSASLDTWGCGQYPGLNLSNQDYAYTLRGSFRRVIF